MIGALAAVVVVCGVVGGLVAYAILWAVTRGWDH